MARTADKFAARLPLDLKDLERVTVDPENGLDAYQRR
jgi:hypothetical protein